MRPSKRIGVTRGAGLAGLMLLVFTGTADAQVRAALVKNVDEPGRTPYQ